MSQAPAKEDDKLSALAGTLIAKKYRVERLLAAGGMGAVLKAHHEALDQAVAIKVMRPELADKSEAAQRFLREARAAAKISSDFVARVTDTGTLEDDTPFMVMEFLEGRDLDQLIEAEGRLPIMRAVDYSVQALAGLAAAHAMGIVHRDLKPSNLFLAQRPDGTSRVKLLDFGISKVVDAAGDRALKAGATTSAGAMLGTPRYMSPEQVSSAKSVDLRTDIWSMGLILYEMLTASYPFQGENSGEILAAILTNPVPPVAGLRPDVPDGVAAVVHRALAKSRHERFETAHAMMQALAPFASKRVQALLPDIEDVASVPTVRADRMLAPTQRSEDAVGSRTAATRIETPDLATPEPPPARAELEGAQTKLSSMVPAAERQRSATESTMSVGRGDARGAGWAWKALGAAVVLGLGGVIGLVTAGGSPSATTGATSEGARPAQTAPPTSTEARGADAAKTSGAPPIDVAPAVLPSVATEPAASAAPPIATSTASAPKATAPPAAKSSAKPTTTSRPGGLLDSRD
ncbi:MAG: protein kinase [Polyangiaceae bacterium]|nr:protein kinase [Polyangiaceae bacterium]